jgi:glutathione peroxidase
MKQILLLIIMSLGISAHAESIYDISVKTIDAKTVKLDEYKNKVILVVNVASQCGYTPQYDGLESIYEKYKSQGFVVLGFPCNQFGEQEPGTNEEIKAFCSSKFNVKFPLFDKIEVNGTNRHPLYILLAGKSSVFAGDITWNFNKFLIGRDGKMIMRYDSSITPESKELTEAIEQALNKK